MSRPSSGSWTVVAVAAVLALPACRSGQGGGGATPAAPAAPGGVAELVGQTRVLRHRGDERKLTLKRDDVARLAGGCDAVVDVTAAALQQGTLRLSLTHVGRPEVMGKRAMRRKGCAPAPATAVVVSRMTGDGVSAVLDTLLPSIERYMGTQGAPFDRAPEEPKAVAADNLLGSTAEGRAAAFKVTAWPTVLFTVDADVPTGKAVAGRENEADFTAVVGADGRLYGPKITTALSEEHVKHITRVLTLWRYQPAKAGDKEVPARVSGKAVLRLY
jgi:hypothetical protein